MTETILIAISLAAAIVAGSALTVACMALSTARGIEKSRIQFIENPQNMTTVEDELFTKKNGFYPPPGQEDS